MLCASLSLSWAKVASLIEPALKDVSSDKKFFGPPFPADYPDDKRPVVQKSILDKLKGPEQPYPALQSKNTFDKDFVKELLWIGPPPSSKGPGNRTFLFLNIFRCLIDFFVLYFIL